VPQTAATTFFAEALNTWSNEMNRHSWLVTAAFVLLAVVALRSRGSGEEQAADSTPAKWEYRVLSQTELDKAGGLAVVGEQGWELAALEPKFPKLTGFNVNLPVVRVDKTTGIGSANGQAAGLTHTYEPTESKYFFKRPKK
jgi:hypothetical protein